MLEWNEPVNCLASTRIVREAKKDPRPDSLNRELARALGVRRSARLRAIARMTALPPEVLLDLAIEIVDIASRKLAPPPIKRTALGLGAARWRHVSATKRSEILRRAAQARWAKHRTGGSTR
jgi:hypothetical protein